MPSIGHSLASVAPDPAPVIHLRELLAKRRQAGVVFAEAWHQAREIIDDTDLAALSGVERQSWAMAFHATRDEWHRAYLRVGKPMKLGPDLHDTPSERITAELVA